MTPGVTERLSEFVAPTSSRDIPDAAIERARIMFLDIIGDALAGSVVGDAGRIAIECVADIGGVPESTVIGGGFRTSAPYAALTNTMLAHALDFDDWGPIGHPSCMLVGTTLALGEKLHATGKAVLEAYIIGLEVYASVSIGYPTLNEKGWHGTAIIGTLGAAAAGARMLGLDTHRTAMTLGIAASTASGLVLEHGTMTKGYQVGKAARHGVEAALLASRGFTGDGAVVENPGGFCDCFLGKGACDYSAMARDLGRPFHIVSPGVGIKPYPCGGVKFFRVIEGILDLRREHGFTCDDVMWVEARVSRRQNSGDIIEPKTGLEGKYSTRYLCARCLLDGRVTVDTFTDNKVSEPAVKEAMAKVRVVVDSTIPDDLSDAWSTVTIELKDGRKLSKRVDIPRGDERNPLPFDSVVQKYRANASLVLPPEKVEQVLNLVQNLDRLEHLRELMDAVKQR